MASFGVWLLAALVPLAFYVATAAPGLAHADQAIAIDAMCSGAISAAATHHSLTAVLGYVPCHAGAAAGIARRANLLSALLGAGAVVAFLAALRRLMPWTPAILASLYLMVSHSMWWHATVAEVYAANALVCALVLAALVRYDADKDERWLWAAAIVAGLGAFNHLQMGFWQPALLLAAWVGPGPSARERLARALRVAAALAVGLLPLGAAFLADLSRGGGLRGAAGEAAGGEFTSLFFTFSGPEIVNTVRLFSLQWGWPSLFWAFVAWGTVRLARGGATATSVAVATAFAINTAFFAGYPTWDKFAFLLCSFVLATFVGALGLAEAWKRYGATPRGRVALVAVNVAMLAYVPLFFRRLPEVAAGSAWWARYRTPPAARLTMLDGTYAGNPDKHAYDRVERYVAGLARTLPSRATLVDHVGATCFQFRHARRYRGARPDLALRTFVPAGLAIQRWPDGLGADAAPATLAADLGRGPVFVTSIVLYGFHDVAGHLLDSDLTFVERPVDGDLVVYELVPGSTVVAGAGVELARETDRTFVVRFARRNPPLRLGIAWRDAGGRAVAPAQSFKIPYDCPPTRFEAPPSAVAADVSAFGVAVGSLTLASAAR